MSFDVIPPILDVETIAVGKAIRELRRLVRSYGRGNWRKLKGYAMVRLSGGDNLLAEVHWYEAHGIGRREFKIKRFIDG